MSDQPEFRFEITRETVLSGAIRDYIRSADPTAQLQTDAEHRAAVMRMLAERPDGGGDVWLFAYGSLIWNPMVEFVERRVATVRGYHRRFCLWSHLGRGSAHAPGLILGLERGGVCRGVAYRIAAARAQEELELVWRREMATTVYCPRWVSMPTPEGAGRAIAFVVNRSHPRYAGLLSEAEIAAAIARAKGPLGPCAAYLFNTVEHLEALGVPDRRLGRLRDQVRAALATAPV
ncbi:MAG TPA: gamma-glutamylcyclotransferase [Stellaceae bacterium]|nr:gamma-glutamylcyclotransferase [Stellaceae bacterium]